MQLALPEHSPSSDFFLTIFGYQPCDTHIHTQKQLDILHKHEQLGSPFLSYLRLNGYQPPDTHMVGRESMTSSVSGSVIAPSITSSTRSRRTQVMPVDAPYDGNECTAFYPHFKAGNAPNDGGDRALHGIINPLKTHARNGSECTT